MRIAGTIFESLAKAGGYEIFTYNLFKSLTERGHDTCLYLPHRELRKRADFYSALPFRTRPMIPRTHSVLKRAPWLLQTHLAWQQRKHKYDVWQTMGAYPEAFSVLKVKAPKVVRNYGEDVQLAPEHGYGIRRDPLLEQKVVAGMLGMDRTIAMTPSLAALQQELGVPADRIHRVPNGIDTVRFGKKRDLTGIRERLNIPHDTTVILTIGRNHAKKGFELIPHMAAGMKRAGLSFLWLVVGGGTDKLQPAIDEAGVRGMVRPMQSIGATNTAMDISRLELPVDELIDVYAMADLFVLPSRLEGFSRVLIEAMAAGLPVVTTDAPGCGETFTHGEQGLTCPVDDIGELTRATTKLVSNRKLRKDMAAKALAYSKQFDWSVIAEGYETVYQELQERA